MAVSSDHDHVGIDRRPFKTSAIAAVVASAAALAIGWGALLPAGAADSATLPVATRSIGWVAPSEDLQLETLALPAEPVVAAAPTWREFNIHADTAGFQAELDQCLWVRMDLTPTAPIIGAHNYCGGDVILDMVRGDHVNVTGMDLDGTYIVTGERMAFAGDDATAATSGATAHLILQTCYWGPGMRLLLLSRIPVDPQPVVGLG